MDRQILRREGVRGEKKKRKARKKIWWVRGRPHQPQSARGSSLVGKHCLP